MNTIVLFLTLCLVPLSKALLDKHYKGSLSPKPEGFDECMQHYNVSPNLDAGIYGNGRVRQNGCAIACLFEKNGYLSKNGTINKKGLFSTEDGLEYQTPYENCRNNKKDFHDNCDLMSCMEEEIYKMALSDSESATPENIEKLIPPKLEGFDKCMQHYNVSPNINASIHDIYGDWSIRQNGCAVACIFEKNGYLSENGTMNAKFFTSIEGGSEYQSPYENCRNNKKDFKDNCELIACMREELFKMPLSNSKPATPKNNEREIPKKPEGYDECMQHYNVSTNLDAGIYEDLTIRQNACSAACLFEKAGIMSKSGIIHRKLFTSIKDGPEYKKLYENCRKSKKDFQDNCELIQCIGEEKKKILLSN